MAQLSYNLFILRVVLLSVLFFSLVSGNDIVEGYKDVNNDHHIDQLFHKDTKVNSRKLVMMLDATMHDYDDAGANPKHDPRRRPGNGRNP